MGSTSDGAIKSVTVNDDGTVTTVYKPQAKTKYAPSPQRNHKGIQLDEREYNKVCSEFNSLNPGSKKGETDLVSKNGIRYFVESDGEGGITIYRAWEED